MNTITVTLYRGVFRNHFSNGTVPVQRWESYVLDHVVHGVRTLKNAERPSMTEAEIAEAETLLWFALGKSKAIQFDAGYKISQTVEFDHRVTNNELPDYLFDAAQWSDRGQVSALCSYIALLCTYLCAGIKQPSGTAVDPAAHARRISGLAEHERITKI